MPGKPVRRKPTPTTAVANLFHDHVPLGLCLLVPAAIGMFLYIWLLPFTTALVLIWLVLNVKRQTTALSSIRANPVNIAMLLFCVALAASIFWSRSPGESLFKLWQAVLPIAVCWAYLLEPDPERFWKYVCRIGAVIGLTFAILSCYQHLILAQETRSVFFTRNTHAGFLSLVLLLTFTYAVRSSMASKKSSPWFRAGLASLLFILSFSIGLTTSRGAILSLLIGFGLVIAMLVKYRLMQHAFGWITLVLLAFALALFLPLGSSDIAPLAQRESLTFISDRLLIWSNTWKMLMDAPWVGIGIGVYPLAWPPYKDPRDSSAGLFVHNDYLQLWVEAGLPSLLLLLAIGIFLFVQYLRIARSRTWRAATRIEITGLGAALLTVSAHSFVDFNFHVPAFMLTIGLVLGRFSRTISPGTGSSTWSWALSNDVKRNGRVVVIAVAILAVLYLFTYGLGNTFAKLGTQRARAGELIAADSAFRTAALFGALNDRALLAYADFLRQLLHRLPPATETEKQNLFDRSYTLLRNAGRLNSLSWDSAAIRARLYQDNPGLVGPEWFKLSADSYRHSLALNPWSYQTRMDLAMLLLNSGDVYSATDVLWSGMHFAYPRGTGLLPFYTFALAMHKQWGTQEQVTTIKQKMDALEKWMTDADDASGDCPIPVRVWGKCQ